jgi:hypothetical protein
LEVELVGEDSVCWMERDVSRASRGKFGYAATGRIELSGGSASSIADA